MFTYKAVNNATGERYFPVKIEWNNAGSIISLSIWKENGQIRQINNPLNWIIEMVYDMSDGEIKKIVEENKNRNEKWKIGKIK